MQIHRIALYLIFHPFPRKMMDMEDDLSQICLTKITMLLPWMEATRHRPGPDNTRLHGLREKSTMKSILISPQTSTHTRKISLDRRKKLSANLSQVLSSH